MAKKIGIAVTIVLLLILGVLLFREDKVTGERDAYYAKREKKLKPLDEEKKKAEKELKELTEEYERQIVGTGSVILVFTGMKEEVYTEIYPIMKKYGYTGVLTLSSNQFPGLDGCMSIEQFQELMGAGWTTCVAWEGVPSNGGWLYALTKKMEAAGIARSDVMYFPRDTYAVEDDALLQTLGFTVAVHHGEAGLPLILTQAEEGLWHPGAVGMKGETPKYKLQDAAEKKGNLVFTIGYELKEEMYSERTFTSMLDSLKQEQKKSGLKVTGFAEARNHRREVENGGASLTAAYEEKKIVLEEKIREAEKKIADFKDKEGM